MSDSNGINKKLFSLIQQGLNNPANTNTLFAENIDELEQYAATRLAQAKIKDIESDIELKKDYATGFLTILKVQLVAMNLVFVAVGLEWLKLAETTINIFMTGTLAEVFGVVFVITRYLFPKK